MAETRLISQPIERSTAVSEYLIYANLNHDASCLMFYIPYTKYNVDMKYILHLTYIHGWYKVTVNRVRLLPSQLLWNFPDHLKSTAQQRRKKCLDDKLL